MGGICGILEFGRNIDRSLLERMSRKVAHRGPDAHGIVVKGRIGLANRRFRIVDPSPAGDQPMWDTEKRVMIVLDGAGSEEGAVVAKHNLAAPVRRFLFTARCSRARRGQRRSRAYP